MWSERHPGPVTVPLWEAVPLQDPGSGLRQGRFLPALAGRRQVPLGTTSGPLLAVLGEVGPDDLEHWPCCLLIFQAGMEGLFLGGSVCGDLGFPVFKATLLTPRALAVIFPGGLMMCAESCPCIARVPCD